MHVDTDSLRFWVPLVTAVAHFVLGVFVRPRVSSETWETLGATGRLLDKSFGNYGTTANKDAQ